MCSPAYIHTLYPLVSNQLSKQPFLCIPTHEVIGACVGVWVYVCVVCVIATGVLLLGNTPPKPSLRFGLPSLPLYRLIPSSVLPVANIGAV